MKTAVTRTLIKEAGKAASVHQLHSHVLRHFCAARLMKAGLDMRKIQIHSKHSEVYTYDELRSSG